MPNMSRMIFLILVCVAERVEDCSPCRHHFGQFLCLAEKPQSPEWHTPSPSWRGCVGHQASDTHTHICICSSAISINKWNGWMICSDARPSYGGNMACTQIITLCFPPQERHLCWNEPALWDPGSVSSLWDVSTTPQLQHQWGFRTTCRLHRRSWDGPQVCVCVCVCGSAIVVKPWIMGYHNNGPCDKESIFFPWSVTIEVYTVASLNLLALAHQPISELAVC